MLRLGSKYEIEHVRAEAIRRLRRTFPDSLDRFDSSADRDTITHRLRYGLVLAPPSRVLLIRLDPGDIIAVINLARMYQLDSLLPAAFYECPQLDETVWMRGYTQKTDQPRLSVEDIVRCIRGRERLCEATRDAYHFFLWGPFDDCENESMCTFVFSDQANEIWGAVEGLSGALRSNDMSFLEICNTCLDRAKHHWDVKRSETWDSLRDYFDLPPLGRYEIGRAHV